MMTPCYFKFIDRLWLFSQHRKTETRIPNTPRNRDAMKKFLNEVTREPGTAYEDTECVLGPGNLPLLYNIFIPSL